MKGIHHTRTNFQSLSRHRRQNIVVFFAILGLFQQGNGLAGDDCSGFQRPLGDHVTIKIVAVFTGGIQDETVWEGITPRYRVGALVLKRLFIVIVFQI